MEWRLGIEYVLKRLCLALVVLWAAITFSFFIPRTPLIISSVGPSLQRLTSPETIRPVAAKKEDAVSGYYARVFHLDRPLHEQYLIYLGDVFKWDLGPSMYYYPKTVQEVIGEALPWTVGLLGSATLLGFGLGSLLGVFLAWPKAPGWAQYLILPLLTLSAVPFYQLGLVLAYIFSVLLQWLPIGGGYPLLVFPSWSWSFVLGTLHHAILPTAAVTLSVLGFWAVGMRGMVITTLGEDYVVLAEAKGLKQRTLMLRYAARNALLPQVTGLALSVGNVVTGAVLVEVVFAYPGIGTLLKWALLTHDYPLMQGITLILVIAIVLITLLLDLALPLLDPRIGAGRA